VRCVTQIALAVRQVFGVHKLAELGTPEAYWVCKVVKLPPVVTMDGHGNSLHDSIEQASSRRFQQLLGLSGQASTQR
jgi:fumarate hydratase subunit beta